MTDVNELVDQVGAELVGAVGRYHQRRRKRIRVASAAAVVLVMLAGVALVGSGLPGTSSAQALAITPEGSSVTVRVSDAAADPASMTDELRKAGVNAEVRAEPVAPGDIGHWLASGTVGHAGPVESQAIVRDLATQIRLHPDFLRLEKGLSTEVSLIVGRAADPGERICAENGAVVIHPDGKGCPDIAAGGGPASQP